MTTEKANSNTQFLWDSPSLLVPVDVEALVVSSSSLNLPWACNAYNYNNTNKFEDIRPSMFQGTKPEIGVALHWALPDGLTHGVQDGNEEINYPLVPNRWLVVRYFGGQTKSWVLQSDFLNPSDGQNLFLDPNQNTPAVTRLGKIVAESSWNGETGLEQEQFLQAVGPGNPSFAAFTANIHGVFSFRDSMDDIIDNAQELTYAVIGWYSEAGIDPLNKFTSIDEWLALLDGYRWTVGDANDLQRAVNNWTSWAGANGITVDPDKVRDLYPSRTVCHGMVYKVNWLGKNGKLQSGVPQYDPGMPADEQPKIAIANTAIDALSALVKYELIQQGETEEAAEAAAEMLEAINYNLLDKYETQGGQFQLYREIFKAWFANNDGEKLWYIEDSENPETPVIDPDILKQLIELNQKEAQLNTKNHLLGMARQNLFGNWWKTGKADTFWGKPPQGITPEQWTTIQDNLKKVLPENEADINQLQQDVDGLSKEISDLINSIREELAKKKDKDGNPIQTLKNNTAGRYHDPNDPVVLVYGAKRGYRHGEDGRFNEDDYLFTRFTGQDITGLNVALPDQAEQAVTTSNVTLPEINIPANLLPKETQGLNGEDYFFDTLNAEAIAKEACTLLDIPFQDSYTQVVQKQQTSAWNADVHGLDRQAVADASGFIGTIPSKISVQVWAAPWAPLLMSWEIKWFPSYDTPSGALKNWTFNAETLEYEWNTGTSISGPGLTLSGSTIITPKSTFTMQAQLEKYFEDTGKFPDLDNFLNTVSNWDFLSQSISGLNELLLTLNPDQLNTPPENIASLTNEANEYSPDPDQGAGYYPLRAGHFQISKLWIIDNFGQVFDPISAVGQEPANYHPVVGTGMETPNNPNLVQLPPRVTQSTRFNFNLVSGDGQSDTLGENQTVNPIAGWLLPNHLDKGLSLYTPDGLLMGELLLTGGFDNETLRWDTAPGINVPVGAPLNESIENKYMLGFVTKLLQQTDNAAAFNDFLSVIDETLWAVEPLGGRQNELISVFIGRPLALVRTKMQYVLRDGLVFSQSWLNSTLNETGGYEGVPFPVQVGCLQDPQDGTIGYFFDDFTTFNTLVDPEKTSSGYITNNPVSLSLTDPEKEIFVLVDPRGEMNVITGILPIGLNVLPGPQVEEAMANMNVTFRTGPLITNPAKLAMPLPSEISGNWSWIQHTGVTTWEEISDIAQGNSKARFGVDYVLKDGWLKLSNALTQNMK